MTLAAAGVCTVSGTTVHLTAIGTCTLTGTQAGNAVYSPATGTATIKVVWPFNGFLQPVDNPGISGVFNTVTAGSAVPVKFSLSGNRVSAFWPRTRQSYECRDLSEFGAPVDDIETYAGATSGLQYDAASDQYTYVWKIVKGQTGCRQLNVKLLADGSDHIVFFKYK